MKQFIDLSQSVYNRSNAANNADRLLDLRQRQSDSGKVDSQDGANWRHFIYGASSAVPDYMRDGASNYMIVYDHLGSVRRVVHSITGAVVQSIDYDVWGNVVADSAPGFQPFGWAGGLADTDTGLVRFGARDYSPEMMRWTARDPALYGGGVANLYEYCFGDPLNYADNGGKRAGPVEGRCDSDAIILDIIGVPFPSTSAAVGSFPHFKGKWGGWGTAVGAGLVVGGLVLDYYLWSGLSILMLARTGYRAIDVYVSFPEGCGGGGSGSAFPAYPDYSNLPGYDPLRPWRRPPEQ